MLKIANMSKKLAFSNQNRIRPALQPHNEQLTITISNKWALPINVQIFVCQKRQCQRQKQSTETRTKYHPPIIFTYKIAQATATQQLHKNDGIRTYDIHRKDGDSNNHHVCTLLPRQLKNCETFCVCRSPINGWLCSNRQIAQFSMVHQMHSNFALITNSKAHRHKTHAIDDPLVHQHSTCAMFDTRKLPIDDLLGYDLTKMNDSYHNRHPSSTIDYQSVQHTHEYSLFAIEPIQIVEPWQHQLNDSNITTKTRITYEASVRTTHRFSRISPLQCHISPTILARLWIVTSHWQFGKIQHCPKVKWKQPYVLLCIQENSATERTTHQVVNQVETIKTVIRDVINAKSLMSSMKKKCGYIHIQHQNTR